jgi:hypothetical protein
MRPADELILKKLIRYIGRQVNNTVTVIQLNYNFTQALIKWLSLNLSISNNDNDNDKDFL